MKRAYLIAIGALFLLFGAIWTFNHVNPWVSLAIIAVVIYFVIHKLSKTN